MCASIVFATCSRPTVKADESLFNEETSTLKHVAAQPRRKHVCDSITGPTSDSRHQRLPRMQSPGKSVQGQTVKALLAVSLRGARGDSRLPNACGGVLHVGWCADFHHRASSRACLSGALDNVWVCLVLARLARFVSCLRPISRTAGRLMRNPGGNAPRFTKPQGLLSRQCVSYRSDCSG
jgi:hypothetical protein